MAKDRSGAAPWLRTSRSLLETATTQCAVRQQRLQQMLSEIERFHFWRSTAFHDSSLLKNLYHWALCYASGMAEDELVSGLPWSKGLTVQEYALREICKIVEGTKWADNLSAKEVETLSRYLHVCTAEAGSLIVQQGRREAYLCLIVEGRVSILKQGVGNRAKQIGSAGPGRIVGEMSLIDGEPRSASVVADEPTTLLVLTGEGFARLSSEVPRLGVKLLLKIAKLISQRLRQTSGALVDYLGG